MDGIEATPAPDNIGSAETATDITPDTGVSVETGDTFTDVTPTPEEGQEVTPEWLQERYKQMQADYTRKRQADAEAAKARADELEFLDALRNDPETQKAVFEQLQELLAAEEESGEFEDPEAAASEESELERTVRELRERAEQQEMQQLATSIMSHIETLAKEAGVELDEADTSDLFRLATAGEISNATTQQAFQQWHARETAKQARWQQAYLASKQAPTQVPAGTAAAEKVDLSKSENRIARMAAIIGGGAS
jgi:hypothetical protein